MVEEKRTFTRGGDWLTPEEKTVRDAVCLNGAWAFQPVPIPENYQRNTGTPPELTQPSPDNWEKTPLIVPSPWNGNTWGNGTIDRDKDEKRKYYPDSVYYPSYPAHWNHVEMGWLKRGFNIPETWRGKRILLHFEAVMGNVDIIVNGTAVGSHFDGYTPFTIDITEQVKFGENELLAGVRKLKLYDEQSAVYKKMRTTYPHGSNTQGLGGIWQDVWLTAVPDVYIEDVFVQPYCFRNLLRAEVTLRNTSDKPVTVKLSGNVTKWRENKILLNMADTEANIPANSVVTAVLETQVDGELEYWSMDSPVLHSLEITAGEDKKSTRFGWREFKLEKKNLLLNGDPVQLVGDICHPFGPYMFSREFVQSWYKLIKDTGGNAVRLHAQPHPRVFLETADEMGLAVMDETAIFGSCISLNFESDIAWRRYENHYNDLIKRDRNHPSVFSWSFGNELFAIFLYDDAAERDQDKFYEKLIEFGKRSLALDPTRDFITCDGDQDLRGTLPVWSKHFGHGKNVLPEDIDKPMVVGENGGTYYAKPEQLTVFNGAKAYESYSGRNNALAIDLYRNIRTLQPSLCYFSPSELMWFGCEPLPYGFNDFNRLPNENDGVFFDIPKDGTPGIFLQRIPPYTGNLNPGWDSDLPEYRPLDMIIAMREGLQHNPELDDKWNNINIPEPEQMPEYDKRQSVRFIGAADSEAYTVLGLAGLKFTVDGEAVIIDGASAGEKAKEILEQVTKSGGTAMILLNSEQAAAKVSGWLNSEIALTDFNATMLCRGTEHDWTKGFTPQNMYTAQAVDKYIMKKGMAGELIDKSQVLLFGSYADWSLFNDVPEVAKCGTMIMTQQHNWPSRAALAVIPFNSGTVVLTTLRMAMTKEHIDFYHRLLKNMGLQVGDIQPIPEKKGQSAHDLLLNGPVGYDK